LTLLVENFLFPESLAEIFSYPKKDHQMAYKLKKEIELRTKNNGTEHQNPNFELSTCLKSNLPNNVGNGREV